MLFRSRERDAAPERTRRQAGRLGDSLLIDGVRVRLDLGVHLGVVDVLGQPERWELVLDEMPLALERLA